MLLRVRSSLCPGCPWSPQVKVARLENCCPSPCLSQSPQETVRAARQGRRWAERLRLSADGTSHSSFSRLGPPALEAGPHLACAGLLLPLKFPPSSSSSILCPRAGAAQGLGGSACASQDVFWSSSGALAKPSVPHPGASKCPLRPEQLTGSRPSFLTPHPHVHLDRGLCLSLAQPRCPRSCAAVSQQPINGSGLQGLPRHSSHLLVVPPCVVCQRPVPMHLGGGAWTGLFHPRQP